MEAGRWIPDAEYRSIEKERRQALSQGLIGCGLSMIEIAKRTRIGRATVARAINGEGIWYSSAIRLEYFLSRYEKEGSSREEAHGG